jgi:hypothetical protein
MQEVVKQYIEMFDERIYPKDIRFICMGKELSRDEIAKTYSGKTIMVMVNI